MSADTIIDEPVLSPGDLILIRSDISYSMIIGSDTIEEEDLGVVTERLDEHAFVTDEILIWDPADMDSHEWMKQHAVNCYIKGQIYCFYECELIKLQDRYGNDKDSKRN